MQDKLQTKLKTYAKDSLLLISTALLAIVLGSQVPKWYKIWQGPYKKGDFSVHVNSQQNRLTLYGTSTCPHCESARRFLNQAKIPYNDLRVDQSKTAATAYKQLGEEGVPILVSKDQMLVGFNEKTYIDFIKTVKIN